jgi:hypothetical protein
VPGSRLRRRAHEGARSPIVAELRAARKPLLLTVNGSAPSAVVKVPTRWSAPAGGAPLELSGETLDRHGKRCAAEVAAAARRAAAAPILPATRTAPSQAPAKRGIIARIVFLRLLRSWPLGAG